MRPQVFLSLILLVVGSYAQAADSVYSVFDIKKTMPINGRQKVYKDFYVNMGEDQGVKPGSILAVYRRQGVVDNFRNVLHEDLLIPVAHMKVIQSSQTISIARLESVTPARQIPVVDFNNVMLGDRVELVTGKAKKADKAIIRKIAGKKTS